MKEDEALVRMWRIALLVASLAAVFGLATIHHDLEGQQPTLIICRTAVQCTATNAEVGK